MTATAQSWLLVIAAIAGAVILFGKASSIWNWVLVKFDVRGEDTLPKELQLIVTMVKASQLITDADQKQKVLEACHACFHAWINAEVPPIPPQT